MYANSLDVPAKRGNQTYHRAWLFGIIISSATILDNHQCASSQILEAMIYTVRVLCIHTD